MFEGFNIGFINFFVIFLCVNDYGFFESFYCRVVDGKIIDDVIYLLVIEEGEYVIVQVNVEVDEEGNFVEDLVLICYKNEFIVIMVENVNLMDVFFCQVVFVVVLFILFFEYDDVNWVFMGLNMQC